MSRKINPFKQCLNKLQILQKTYPSQTLGMHLSRAMSDYGDLWGVTDREFLFALERYELEMENNIASDNEVERIIKEGQNLTILFQEDEENDTDLY